MTRRVQSHLGIRTRGDIAAIAVRKLAFVPRERPIIVRSRVERRHECCANIDATTAMGVLNGVISEVFDHAAQLFPVGHGYRHVRIGLRGKRNILIGGYWVERLFNESKQVNKVYWLDEQLVAVGFGFRDGENVIYQIKKQRSICLDIGNGFVRFFIEIRVLEQQARESEDRRERRAQLGACQEVCVSLFRGRALSWP